MTGRRDADVAADALRFPLLELRQRLLRIAHVVELQQIELLRLQSGQRALELGGVGRLELGGDEELVAQAAGRDHVAEHGSRHRHRPTTVSISRPPPAISACSTAAAFCRVASSSVSKTCAVPRPTAGRRSPLLGMARVSSAVGLRERRRRQHRRAGRDREFASRHADRHAQSPCAAAGVHQRGAAFLRPSQRRRQDEPARRHRQRARARSRRALAPAPAGCRTPSRTTRRSRDRSPRRSGSWPCTSPRAPSTVKNTWRAGLAIAKFIQRCATWTTTTTASVGASASAAKPTT